jgi:methanogenic corrinoid protein MtbC1
MAVELGHNISAVAPLGDEELTKLIGRSSGKQNTAGVFQTVEAVRSSEDWKSDAQVLVSSALNHVKMLDAASLEKVLSNAAVAMPRQAFLQAVIMPLFQEIGELWSAGKLKIINEHMASVVVRSILWDMLRTVETSVNAPRIVIATPVGHWHEFGALASALAASESGWKVFYFGPNLPSEEIAYAVKKVNAQVLTLSLCHRLNDHKLAVEFKKLRRLVGPQITIYMGGAGALAAKKFIKNINATVIDDLKMFREKMGSLLGG